MYIRKYELTRSIVTMTNEFIDMIQNCNQYLYFASPIKYILITIQLMMTIILFIFRQYIKGIISMIVLFVFTGLILVEYKYTDIEYDIRTLDTILKDGLMKTLKTAVFNPKALDHMTYQELEQQKQQLTNASIQITKLERRLHKVKYNRMRLDVVLASCMIVMTIYILLF